MTAPVTIATNRAILLATVQLHKEEVKTNRDALVLITHGLYIILTYKTKTKKDIMLKRMTT